MYKYAENKMVKCRAIYLAGINNKIKTVVYLKLLLSNGDNKNYLNITVPDCRVSCISIFFKC